MQYAQPPPYNVDRASAALAAADPVLARLIEQIGPCGLEVRGVDDMFEYLVRCIVYQQLSGKAAGTIHSRVLALMPNGLSPKGIDVLEDVALRGAGLSRNKLAALRDLSRRAAAGEIPDRATLDSLPDATIIERLTRVRGIGVWTVQMLLLGGLCRPDVWPSTDLGVRQGYQLAYGLDAAPGPKTLDKLVAHWPPYRSVAAWYLWRLKDTPSPTQAG